MNQNQLDNGINAGKYRHKIQIYKTEIVTDEQGFQSEKRTLIFSPYAEVVTTKGMTIYRNDSDFEKALTRFTIRYPKSIVIERKYEIDFKGKTYLIKYVNNVNEADVELELQAEEVTH